MKMITDYLQLIGGIILVLGYFPQIHKILKTKSVKDFNVFYLVFMFVGIAMMEVYAVYNLLQGVAVMFFLTNTLSLLTSAVMLLLYVIYRERGRR